MKIRFVLFAIFVLLKITRAVTWSWWVITAPLWLLPALIIGGAAALLVGITLVYLLDAIEP